jgi:hypothetical protein
MKFFHIIYKHFLELILIFLFIKLLKGPPAGSNKVLPVFVVTEGSGPRPKLIKNEDQLKEEALTTSGIYMYICIYIYIYIYLHEIYIYIK